MAGGDISAIIDSLIYNSGGSYYNRLIRVPGTNIYIVGDRVGAGADLTLYTFSCDALGNIGAAPIDSLVLEAAGTPSGMGALVHVYGDIFACAFIANTQVVVKTFSCDASGNLGAAAIDTINLGAVPANKAFLPDLKQVQSDIYVVGYTPSTNNGIIATIRINNDGTIDEPVLSSYTYETYGIKPYLLKVTNNHFLHIAGETTPGVIGKVRQINITDAGIISQIADAFIFDLDHCEGGTIHQVSGNVYVIFYFGGASPSHGRMVTITADFSVTPTPIDSWDYYGAAIDWPRGIEISSNLAGNGKIYAVMSGIDGAVANQLRTFEILNSGTITKAAIDTQLVNARYANGPDIVHGVGDICVISARSGPTLVEGTVYSVTIESVILGPPTVTTDPASELATISATLNGTLNNDGGEACACGFQWGPDTSYGNTTPTQSRTTGQAFAQVIQGLLPRTRYHFRAFATNSAGTSYGVDRSFITTPITSRAYALAREDL